MFISFLEMLYHYACLPGVCKVQISPHFQRYSLCFLFCCFCLTIVILTSFWVLVYMCLWVCTWWGTCTSAFACTCMCRSERALSILRCSLSVSMSQCLFLNFDVCVSAGLDASQPQQSSELELQAFAGTSGLLHGWVLRSERWSS